MKTLYFDCFAGVSGDMILGAMVAAGVEQRALKQQLGLLSLQGFEIDFVTVNRSGISATHARVQCEEQRTHRHLGDILKIINASHLSDAVRDRAAKIFSRLAEAEAHVHNEPVDHVHFHEVGALDAIVDVAGAAICFELLGIERFVCSPLHVGSGTVDMDHGRFPVPPPAVTELLKGAPVYATEIKGELVTPTGAAIIATVCEEFGALPWMTIERTGYGAGTREYEKFPNVLRVFVGEEAVATESGWSGSEQLWMIETNIDDSSPQVFGHVMDLALEMGALDCYFTPVQMKKNRPGVLLSVLCRNADRKTLSQMLFKETTTLGLRSYEVERQALDREVVSVETRYGPIDVKVARMDGQIVNQMPEYDQCRRAALKAAVPLRQVEEEAKFSFGLLQRSRPE
ncbi:MAG: nickel pincer cofactor biosynthesis protein LarC [Acidobacteriota bacterium]|nr:nickel pincer cofactor biosynthesis protein LarC [Acidobacteriota bacterium]